MIPAMASGTSAMRLAAVPHHDAAVQLHHPVDGGGHVGLAGAHHDDVVGVVGNGGGHGARTSGRSPECSRCRCDGCSCGAPPRRFSECRTPRRCRSEYPASTVVISPSTMPMMPRGRVSREVLRASGAATWKVSVGPLAPGRDRWPGRGSPSATPVIHHQLALLEDLFDLEVLEDRR